MSDKIKYSNHTYHRFQCGDDVTCIRSINFILYGKFSPTLTSLIPLTKLFLNDTLAYYSSDIFNCFYLEHKRS